MFLLWAAVFFILHHFGYLDDLRRKLRGKLADQVSREEDAFEEEEEVQQQQDAEEQPDEQPDEQRTVVLVDDMDAIDITDDSTTVIDGFDSEDDESSLAATANPESAVLMLTARPGTSFFDNGQRVVVGGLKSKAHLNGIQGTVVHFDESKDLYRVAVAGLRSQLGTVGGPASGKISNGLRAGAGHEQVYAFKANNLSIPPPSQTFLKENLAAAPTAEMEDAPDHV